MKVAVVGSGCSGLAATWALNEYSPHEVHLFEADSRLGGHAHSVKFVNPNDQKESTMIDTAFMVYNPSCYPNFTRLLKFLNVEPIESDMSFSLSRNNGQFEWASSSLRALFCQPHNIFNLRMWRMLWDILRFNACARRFIVECEKLAGESEMTIDEYLQKNGYSDAFRDDYLMPMTAAIWSTPPEVCATSYTAQSLLRYMHNHHLLRIFRKPSWLTIKGGSHNYVEKIANNLPPSHLHLSTRIKAVAPISVNGKIKIALEDSTRKIEHYDHVILACHANTSLALLAAGGMITQQERSILGMFSWTQNEMVVHSDISAMPQNRDAWVAWNYLTESSRPGEKSNSDTVTVTGYLNILQKLDLDRYGPILCTINPKFPIREDLVQARIPLEHPAFDVKALRAQAVMPSIQNKRGISFAGAWMGYAFHEDGITAGLEAALALGDVKLPFELMEADRKVQGLWLAPAFDLLELFRRYLVSLLLMLYVVLGQA